MIRKILSSCFLSCFALCLACSIQHDVKLWGELNAPHWTLERLYPADKFHSPDEDPNGRLPRPGPVDRTLLEHTILALKAWPASSSVVITSKKGTLEHVYASLREAVPEMKIIGGLKVWPYIQWSHPHYGVNDGKDWLSDSQIWEQFAVDARRVVELTGVPRIIVMAESPMSSFYSGIRQPDGSILYYEPNYSSMPEAMSPLRELTKEGIQIIWYAFGTHKDRTIEEGQELVRGIRNAVPGSWFISVGDGWPSEENSPGQNLRRDAQRAAAGGRLIHHVLVAADGVYVWANGKSKQTYTPLSLQSWLQRRAFAREVWAFPGTYGLVDAGKGFQLLEESSK